MSGAEDAIRFYNVYDEHARFESAEGQFEFARSMELLLRHLPAAPAVRSAPCGCSASRCRSPPSRGSCARVDTDSRSTI